MGRRAQANARTLSWAVRQVFKPLITDVPAANPYHLADRSESLDEELIPTQPPEEPSEKSLGKRKRVEQDEEPATSTLDAETRYTKSTLPPALKKYWQQRYRLFSRYDEGIEMDYDGWFSVTPENIAAQIAERCRCDVVVDAFCGVGGNAIRFAMTCEKVIAIDTSPIRLACARANARIYGVEDRITFIQTDFVQWAKERAANADAEAIDVVFLSPPWGGIDYREDDPEVAKEGYATYPLSRLAPLHGKELFDISRNLAKNIAYYLPRNLDIVEAAALVEAKETVEIEEAWMGSKLKALTLYYGDLANP